MRNDLINIAVGTPAEHNPAVAYMARLAPSSRRTMSRELERAARLLSSDRLGIEAMAWDALRHHHIGLVRAELVDQGLAPSTINKAISALRSVVKESWRLGFATAEDAARAADIPNVKGSVPKSGRCLSAAEIRALFATCDGSPSGLRDAAVLAVMYGCGLRRAEIAKLEMRDIDLPGGRITVERSKGGKTREVYMPDGTELAIARWIAVRGTESGELFRQVRPDGRIVTGRITPQAVLYICRRRSEAAGIQRFSPHDLRRSFASDLLDAGADVSSVQQLMGHADPRTTMRYDRRGERARRKAVQLLRVPA